MVKNKKIKAIFAIVMFLMATLVPFGIADALSETNGTTRVHAADSLIKANQILTKLQQESTHVGIGIVEYTECVLLDGEAGNIATNAIVRVETPLSDNMNVGETIKIQYRGGTVGKLTLTLNILWQYGPQDTVRLPSELNLKVGESILFFVIQQNDCLELLSYVPFQQDTNTASLDSSYAILSETQPATTVALCTSLCILYCIQFFWNHPEKVKVNTKQSV